MISIRPIALMTAIVVSLLTIPIPYIINELKFKKSTQKAHKKHTKKSSKDYFVTYLKSMGVVFIKRPSVVFALVAKYYFLSSPAFP